MPASYYNNRINPNRPTKKAIEVYSPVEEKTVKQEIDPAVASEVVRGAIWWLDMNTITGEPYDLEMVQSLLDDYVENLKKGAEPVSIGPKGYREPATS